MRTVPLKRRQQSGRRVPRRRSRRTRCSLLLVFALVFAPAAAPTARAACVEFATPPAISNAAAGAFAVAAADVDRDGDLDVLSASQSDHEIAWYQNTAGDGSAWLRITQRDRDRRPRREPRRSRRRRIAAWLATADIVAIPSVRDDRGNVDGLPNIVLETMASGTPLITTPAGGIGSVVQPGQTGVVVPERDTARRSPRPS